MKKKSFVLCILYWNSNSQLKLTCETKTKDLTLCHGVPEREYKDGRLKSPGKIIAENSTNLAET